MRQRRPRSACASAQSDQGLLYPLTELLDAVKIHVYYYCKENALIRLCGHYENRPIQIHRKFHLQKLKNFRLKKSDIFHYITAQNIDCGYSLEPPRRGGSNEYPQSIF